MSNEAGENYVHLILEDISVKNGILAEHWISSSRYFISTLKLTSEKIYNIENGAFKGAIFSKIKTLTIEKVSLNSLGKYFFEGLISLKELNFRKCNIEEIQRNALELLQNNLNTLQVQEMEYPWDPVNLTGTAIMHGLSTIHFSHNKGFSTTFNSETFSGSYNVVQLYLMNSHITEIGEKAFVPMQKLLQIYLQDNMISNLNKNVLNLKELKGIHIDGNRWNCSCDLEWLKTLNEKGIAKLNPTCFPSQTYFNKTEFCEDDPCSTTSKPDSSSTEITTVPDETTTTDLSTMTPESTTSTEQPIETESPSTTTDESTSIETETTTEINFGKISLDCSNYGPIKKSSRRKLLSNSLYIANSTIDFEISNKKPGTVQIKIKSAQHERIALLWFPIDPKNSSIIPKCLKLASKSQKESNEININDLIAGKSYTFCFVNDNEEKISPLNCKSHLVKRLTKDEPWISNGSRNLTIGMTILTLLVLCLISALIMYVTVRKYPSLMRGSKRVVMVKHKNVEVIVLPPKFNEVQLETTRMRPHEPEFRRNRFRRSVSEVSMVSGSYISPIEPTMTQLLNFRLERLRNMCGNENVIVETDRTSKFPSVAPIVPPRPLSPIENWDCGSFSGISNI